MLRDEEGRDTEQQKRWEMIREQRPPVTTDGSGPAVWDLVIEDMRQRNVDGTAKYGTPLRTFNGRNPLTDLYQELMDATVYTRQFIERDRENSKSHGYTLTVLVAERDAARSELESARQVIASNGQALCKLQAEKDEAWRQINALTEELADETARSGNIRSIAAKDCDDLKRRIDALTAERDAAKRQVNQVCRERDEAVRLRDYWEKEFGLAFDASRKLQASLDQATAKIAEYRAEIEDDGRALAADAGQREELLKANARIARERDEFREAVKTLTAERNDAISERQRCQKLASDADSQMRPLAQDVANLRRELSQAKASRDSHYSFGQRMERERDEAREELAGVKEELATEKTGACKTAEDLLNELSRTRAERDGAKAELRRAVVDRDEAMSSRDHAVRVRELVIEKAKAQEIELAAFRKVVQVIADPPK